MRALFPTLLLTIVGFATCLISPARAASPTVIELWPEGVPGLRADAAPEVVRDDRIYAVHTPTLTWYPAAPGTANGTAVIVCPGGAYLRLAVSVEGTGAAAWLNPLGVHVFILKYRLKEYGHPAPLRDVLRAVRMVRSHAAEWGVAPDRIGVAGSSAGGHLAACAGTLYDSEEGKTGHAMDKVSARPDFLILQYPVITLREPFTHRGSLLSLLGEQPKPADIALLSVDERVSKHTPPTFIVHTQEDKTVPVENALLFYQALTRAGVPAELHVFPVGPHGFGYRKDLGPTSAWPNRAEEWLRARGLLVPRKP